jgi:signal transduction histidine kinase
MVAALGRDEGGLNLHRLQEKQDLLIKLILERIGGRPYVRSVEVVDRFGAQMLFLTRRGEAANPPEGEDQAQVVTVPLIPGTMPSGEVRLTVSSDEVDRELRRLQASLRLKLILAASFGIGVLVLGLFYVLHLIRKNRKLEQSRLAAERRSYVGLLASGLAHEIRNPLNAMNINLQMLEEELQAGPGFDQSDHGELLVSTKQEIKRLERLANNFLAYARPAQPRFESKDLNQVLREVALFLKADFKQSGVELELDLEPLLPTVDLDDTLFKQAVINLLVNARQVLVSTGHVWLISQAGPTGDALVEVQDDGPGIPEDVRDKIFEVFFSSRGGGTGLGLPIARQIVERHGGTIEVDSTLGQGTTFRIRLPRRHPNAPTSESPVEPLP